MFRTIVVHRRGTSLGKRSERLLLRGPAKARTGTDPDGAEASAPMEPPAARVSPARAAREESAPRDEEEIPFFRVGEIVVPARGVSLSTDLIEEAATRGIPITFVGPAGQPFAMLTSPMLTATIATRRAQLRAMDRPEGAALCRAFRGRQAPQPGQPAGVLREGREGRGRAPRARAHGGRGRAQGAQAARPGSTGASTSRPRTRGASSSGPSRRCLTAGTAPRAR